VPVQVWQYLPVLIVCDRAVKTAKGKKSAASSDDGGWDASPYGTLTRSSANSDSNKYRANARAKLPSIFNPFVKVTTSHIRCVS